MTPFAMFEKGVGRAALEYRTIVEPDSCIGNNPGMSWQLELAS